MLANFLSHALPVQLSPHALCYVLCERIYRQQTVCIYNTKAALTSAQANSLVSLPAIILSVLLFVLFCSSGLGFPLCFLQSGPLPALLPPPPPPSRLELSLSPFLPSVSLAGLLSLAQTSLAEAAGGEWCSREDVKSIYCRSLWSWLRSKSQTFMVCAWVLCKQQQLFIVRASELSQNSTIFAGLFTEAATSKDSLAARL